MAGRALGYSPSEVDALAKNVPRKVRDRDRLVNYASEWDAALSSPAMRGHPLQDQERFALLLELANGALPLAVLRRQRRFEFRQHVFHPRGRPARLRSPRRDGGPRDRQLRREDQRGDEDGREFLSHSLCVRGGAARTLKGPAAG